MLNSGWLVTAFLCLWLSSIGAILGENKVPLGKIMQLCSLFCFRSSHTLEWTMVLEYQSLFYNESLLYVADQGQMFLKWETHLLSYVMKSVSAVRLLKAA